MQLRSLDCALLCVRVHSQHLSVAEWGAEEESQVAVLDHFCELRMSDFSYSVAPWTRASESVHGNGPLITSLVPSPSFTLLRQETWSFCCLKKEKVFLVLFFFLCVTRSYSIAQVALELNM